MAALHSEGSNISIHDEQRSYRSEQTQSQKVTRMSRKLFAPKLRKPQKSYLRYLEQMVTNCIKRKSRYSHLSINKSTYIISDLISAYTDSKKRLHTGTSQNLQTAGSSSVAVDRSFIRG